MATSATSETARNDYRLKICEIIHIDKLRYDLLCGVLPLVNAAIHITVRGLYKKWLKVS